MKYLKACQRVVLCIGRCLSFIICLLVAMPVGADSAAPVFQPDGTIKSTKATLSMSDSGTIVINMGDFAHSIYLCGENTLGNYVWSGHMTQRVKWFDLQARTTSVSGNLPVVGGNIPVCVWMHLKDDGKIRVGVEFLTDNPAMMYFNRVMLKSRTARADLNGHSIDIDGNTKLFLSTDLSVDSLLFNLNSIGTVTYFTGATDSPDQRIRLYNVTSGQQNIWDLNKNEKVVESRYLYTSSMGTQNELAMDVQLPDEASPVVSPNPVFNTDGSITCGLNTLSMASNGSIAFTDMNGISYGLFLSMAFKQGGGFFSTWSSVTIDKLRTVDFANKKVIFTGNIQAPNGLLIPLSFWMQLQENGKVRIQARFDYTAGAFYDLFAWAKLESDSTPRTAYVSHIIQAQMTDGATYDFSILGVPPTGTSGTSLKTGSGSNRMETIAFFTDSNWQTLTIHRAISQWESLYDYNITQASPYINMNYYVEPSLSNQVAIDVEFPPTNGNPSCETYGGVDFLASDSLRMPSFSRSANLISNPSFEHDFQYWGWNTWGGAITQSDADLRYYQIDQTMANVHSGKRSLKLTGKQGKSVGQLAMFTIPVIRGQQYTLSYWAKTDNVAAGKIWIIAETSNAKTNDYQSSYFWNNGLPGVGSPQTLTASWARYSHTFTAPNGLLALGFGLWNPSADCQAWIDDVQLEQASSATTFVQRPVTMSFKTDSEGNFFEAGQNPSSSLVRIVGASGTTGTLSVYRCDFNGHETKKQTTGFTIGSTGECHVIQNWTSGLASGVYVIRMEAQVGGILYRDFGRLAFMTSASLNQAGRKLFAMRGDLRFSKRSEWSRQFDFYTKLGIGAIINFDPPPSDLYSVLNQYQMTHFSSIFEGGDKVASLGIALRTDYDLTANELANLQVYAYNKALANPQITYWKLMNEPSHPCDATNMSKMIAAVQASVNGIKQANPNAKIITNDPSTMQTSYGIPYLNSFLQNGGSSFCDIAAIHTYRATPDTPDFDADCASLMQMLQNRGFTGDVWFTEGIYHQNYVLPPYGLNTHVGCSSDLCLVGPFSYDMGWGERMCAAYTARTWLVSMKYGDRIKMHVDWGLERNAMMDYSFTPTAYVYAINTLVRILGGGTYQGQPVIDSSIRSYVFTDTNGYHVAPIWYYSDETDRGQAVPGILDISNLLSQYGESNLEVVDFMGNVTPINSITSAMLELAPWPQFVRVKTGTVSQFITALNQCVFNQDYMP